MYRRGVSSLPPLAKVNGSTGINFRTPTERNKKGVRKFIPLVLEKHAIQFQFNVSHPLMLFLCLILLAMVDQRPARLFDIREKGWLKYVSFLPANTWVDPQHLPAFGTIFEDFNATN